MRKLLVTLILAGIVPFPMTSTYALQSRTAIRHVSIMCPGAFRSVDWGLSIVSNELNKALVEQTLNDYKVILYKNIAGVMGKVQVSSKGATIERRISLTGQVEIEQYNLVYGTGFQKVRITFDYDPNSKDVINLRRWRLGEISEQLTNCSDVSDEITIEEELEEII